MSLASQAHYGATHGHAGQTCNQAHPGQAHEEWEYQVSFGADPHSDFMAAVNTWCDERPPSFGWGYESVAGFGAVGLGKNLTPKLSPALNLGTRRSPVGGLRQGSTGTSVRDWQISLNRWLTATGGAPIQVDSSFGPATATATRSFQGSQGLTQDAIVGTNTRARMTSWTAAQAGTAGTPGTSQPQAPANSIPLSQANAAIQSVASRIAGAAFVRRDLNVPPSPGSVQVQGVYYLFLDAQGRTVTPHTDVHATWTPPTGGATPPGLFEPAVPGGQLPAVPPAPPAATGTDMKPLLLAGALGLAAVTIIALAIRD